jgi:hypothetical protein
VFDASSISIKKDVSLDLLPVPVRQLFQEESGRLYGATSNYVHLSRAQSDERIVRVDAGRTAARENAEDVIRLNGLLSRVFACALVFLFHSVPQYVAGDWFVKPDGSIVDWYFNGSRFLALIDEQFDYKSERRERLPEIISARSRAISF